MKRTFLSAIIVSAFLIGTIHFAGCGAGGADNEKTKESLTTGDYYTDGIQEEGSNEFEEAKNESPATTAQNQAKSKDGNATSATGGSQTDLTTTESIPVEKVASKIIKTAEISMQVKDYKKNRMEILETIKASGAYIAAENQANTSYNINDDMEIRIKPGGFDSLVEKILGKAIYVDYSKITADDVTEEYVDAEARMKAKEDVETQYKEILKKAYTISEIIAVQEKINKIREEIEAYKAKLKFMDDKVSYSTIKLHFYEKLDEIAAPETGFFYRTGKAFKSGWNGLQMFFIGIIYLWPLWLITLIALYLVFWFIKRNRKRRELKKQ
ncbi:MAG: DUF4349 domain-containing protein [Bacteroidota bacterium]